MRRVLFLLAPRWLALYVLVIAAGVAMVFLARWQWRVAHIHHGSVQNYSYAFQWVAFTVFAVLMLGRVMRDAVRRRDELADRAEPAEHADPRETAAAEPARGEPEPVAYRRYVMPQNRVDTDDPELAAYNAYLAELNQPDER